MLRPEPLLPGRRPAALPASTPPLLLCVVDTEEEFDWSAPFDRGARSVEAMREVWRFQEVCDEHGLVPTYVVDHPIASQETGRRLLAEYRAEGRALIGAHVHPWVSPPHEEEVSARNSYPGNLPARLEEAKLEELARTIERGFGERPTIHKAGRYGLGPNSAAILARAGFTIDLSACPAFDLAGDGGPDWSRTSPEPAWFGPAGELLEIPTTGAFVGWLAEAGAGLHRAATRGPLARLRLAGVLSRLRALERLMLSPEGYTQLHLRRLTRALLARGQRVFSFSLHSPSLRPGCTPYVRDPEQLAELLDSCRQYFSWFLGELGGRASTPPEVRALCRSQLAAPSPHAGRNA